MNTSTTLFNSSPEQLAELIDAKIKQRLDELKAELQSKDANNEILTRDEACEFLQINPSTLWHWQNRGKVQAYKVSGNRRYYKRSELIKALKPISE